MISPKLYTGLNEEQVIISRQTKGTNAIEMQEDLVLLQVLKGIVLEPMFALLAVACTIYFLVGQLQEGFIMMAAIVIVAGIAIFQDYRSRNAIKALKKLSAPKVNVLRNSSKVQITTEELVVDDILLLEEGEIIAADGIILIANDFSINESLLTGESFPVNKSAIQNKNVYKGTLITSGTATVKVEAVGLQTMFGKIGTSLKEISIIKTPLQIQIRLFVKNMVWFGFGAFMLVFAYNYYDSKNFVHALMHGLTLAMSVIPEEIPVAFSTFMALGAFRLLKLNIIVKQPQYVETLGSATVICVDKTGTLTQNSMSIAFLYDAVNKESVNIDNKNNLPLQLIEYAMWSSETDPFDPMEKSIHTLYEENTKTDKRKLFKQVHEYPISGKPPMMTHIFENKSKEIIIAAKGAPEAILRISNLGVSALKHIEEQSLSYAKKGYRVLGVGKGIYTSNKWPGTQQEFVFDFLGLVAFYDPPKNNITQTIETFTRAGITVKMITGDYAETALAIANQIKLTQHKEILTGKEILQMSAVELQHKVKQVDIFARMFPEAKLKVINALKEKGDIVAMTGDGVNDSPALKAAHIGIAMGLRGSEVAKSAASLLLTDDDLSHMTTAIALGRKIYDNLKKAIQYIVSIHIPIILIVILPLLLFWQFSDIFSPVHIIFLELIMGPTCSIIFENEPMEPDTMLRPPRKMSTTFLSVGQLTISIIQGFIIAAGCLGLGYYYMQQQKDEMTVRTIIFITLLFSNIFLTLVNRSFHYSIFTTIRYKNNLVLIITGVTILFIVSFLYVPFMQHLFELHQLSTPIILTSAGVAMISTLWIELWKLFKRKKSSIDNIDTCTIK